MKLQLPEDLDAALDDLATRKGVPKSALLIEGARMVVERAELDDQVSAIDKHKKAPSPPA